MDGIITNPRIFGPGMWIVFHYVAYSCIENPENKESFEQLIKLYQIGTPCDDCRRHFANYAKYHTYNKNNKYFINWKGKKIDVYTFKWSVDCHNMANQSNGSKVLSLLGAMKMYEIYLRKGKK